MKGAVEAIDRRGGPASGPPQRCSPLFLRSKGLFAVRDAEGADLTPRRRKGCALLVYLAAHAGEDVSRERIAALLWSDRGEEQARGSLRQCLYELRGLGALHQLLHVGPSRLGGA